MATGLLKTETKTMRGKGEGGVGSQKRKGVPGKKLAKKDEACLE